MKFVKNNWQGFVFSTVGFFALYHFYFFLQGGKVTEASVVFGFAFLSFLYANLSRFKRFKGLGFEAELWEDKQREAADLIERLKEVVSIYSSQVVESQIMYGRIRKAYRWDENWKLYDRLVKEHSDLGQNIDFSELKKRADMMFLLDMCTPPIQSIEMSLRLAYQTASLDKSVDRSEEQLMRIHDTSAEMERLFRQLPDGNVANDVLAIAAREENYWRDAFSVELKFDQAMLDRLKSIAKLYDERPVRVDAETLAWANEHIDAA